VARRSEEPLSVSINPFTGREEYYVTPRPHQRHPSSNPNAQTASTPTRDHLDKCDSDSAHPVRGQSDAQARQVAEKSQDFWEKDNRH
jgi:hypothetical protein